MADLRKHRLVFHGLRKPAVVFLLEAHCSDAETAAITSQSRDMVEHYCYAGEPEAVGSGRDPEVGSADAARIQNAEEGEFV